MGENSLDRTGKRILPISLYRSGHGIAALLGWLRFVIKIHCSTLPLLGASSNPLAYIHSKNKADCPCSLPSGYGKRILEFSATSVGKTYRDVTE
jgi:hypothetical protein